VRRKTWVWSRFLVIVDYLFGSRLLEGELARRQRKIERLAKDVEVVDRELKAAARELDFSRTTLCLILLKARSEGADVQDWLFFDPFSEGDDDLLDSAIECLVKTQLAGLDAYPSADGHYAYRLAPDWQAIVAHFGQRSLAKELMAWLEQQVRRQGCDGDKTADHDCDAF